jgi:hypothetical protein
MLALPSRFHGHFKDPAVHHIEHPSLQPEVFRCIIITVLSIVPGTTHLSPPPTTIDNNGLSSTPLD